MSCSIPIKDENEKIIGLISADISFDSVKNKAVNVLVEIVGVIIIFSIIIAILSYIIVNKVITKPIGMLENSLKYISNGDYTVEIDSDIRKKSDEIGSIACAIEDARICLQNLAKNIVNNSSRINEILESSYKNINMLSNEVNEISENAEKVSGLIEEMSASSEEMLTSSLLINNSLTKIKQHSEEGISKSTEIYDNSKNMSDKLVESKEVSSAIQEKIDSAVESVEELVINSQEVLNYLDNDVIKSYEIFSHAASNYLVDSSVIKELFEEFFKIINGLDSSISETIRSIEGFSEASMCVTTDVINITSNINNANKHTDNILGQIEDTKNQSNILRSIVKDLKA